MRTVSIKAGEERTITLTQRVDGVAPDLTGAVLTSQLRRLGESPSDAPVATLAAELGDQDAAPGSIEVRLADTADWPIGKAQLDVRIELDDDVTYTDTVDVIVFRSITRV